MPCGRGSKHRPRFSRCPRCSWYGVAFFTISHLHNRTWSHFAELSFPVAVSLSRYLCLMYSCLKENCLDPEILEESSRQIAAGYENCAFASFSFCSPWERTRCTEMNDVIYCKISNFIPWMSCRMRNATIEHIYFTYVLTYMYLSCVSVCIPLAKKRLLYYSLFITSSLQKIITAIPLHQACQNFLCLMKRAFTRLAHAKHATRNYF